MEGFDERRVKKVINLPNHYTIPVIVSIGYSAEEEEDNTKKSQRILPEKLFSKNKFGSKMKDIHSFNE